MLSSTQSKDFVKLKIVMKGYSPFAYEQMDLGEITIIKFPSVQRVAIVNKRTQSLVQLVRTTVDFKPNLPELNLSCKVQSSCETNVAQKCIDDIMSYMPSRN